MLKALIVLIALGATPLSAWAQVQTTVAPPTLPNLGTDQKSPGDADATYCRPPQRRTDSMLMGPKVCMTNQQWNDLHAQGFDIGPDGAKVSMQKHMDMLSH
jgi:hypothetical protein